MSETQPMLNQQLEERLITDADEAFALVYNLDSRAYFTNNPTPPDNYPEPFTLEEVREGLEKGAKIRGIYNSNGLAVAYYWLEQEADSLYIGGVAIDVNYRGKDLGVADYIMQRADVEAINMGLNKCSLTVDPFNSRGLNVYLRSGYRVIGYDPKHFNPPIPRFMMEKYLTTRANPKIILETRTVQCSDQNELLLAIQDGFVGVRLDRSISTEQDPEKTTGIVFERYSD